MTIRDRRQLERKLELPVIERLRARGRAGWCVRGRARVAAVAAAAVAARGYCCYGSFVRMRWAVAPAVAVVRTVGVVVATPVVSDRLTSKIWARVGGVAAPPFPPFLSSFFGMVDDAPNPSSARSTRTISVPGSGAEWAFLGRSV